MNALAREATGVIVRDRTSPVTRAVIDEAKETLVRTRPSHLQSLGSRLEDPRVRPLLEAVLAGGEIPQLSQEDRDYVVELGMLRVDEGQVLRIANPIYEDALPRALAATIQLGLPATVVGWLGPEGQLVTARLLAGFLDFWQRHGRALIHTAPYHAVAPHLVLMAWLHKVCNGGGSLEREFAIGTGRMDLCLRYGAVVLGIELKVWRAGRADPLEEGLVQLDGYLAGLRIQTGWLVIFDCRTAPDSTRSPGSKRRVQSPEPTTTAEARTSPAGHTITVVRA